MVESNIDDVTGEMMGFVMEKLQGFSLDVYYTPVYMKKNRPAYKLSVLCENKYLKEVEEIIFRHTTTIGVRKYPVDREILDRKKVSSWYKDTYIKAKVVEYKGEEYIYPEYESAKELALRYDIPLTDSYDIIKEVIKSKS